MKIDARVESRQDEDCASGRSEFGETVARGSLGDGDDDGGLGDGTDKLGIERGARETVDDDATRVAPVGDAAG